MDQKSLETVFSLVICRQSGNKWQSKTLFLMIFLSTFVDSINVIECRLSGVMMLDEKYNVSQINRFWFLSQMRAVRLRLACANAQSHQSYMGLDARKPVLRSVRTTKAQTVQRLCYSLIGKYHI